MSDTLPLRVLIVDNHPAFWEAGRWSLQQDRRFKVVDAVQTVAAAMPLLSPETVDLVLLGVRLPDLDTRRAVQRLRARHGGVKIVLIGADLQVEHHRQARRAAVQGCLTKDTFSPASLAAVLGLPDVG